MAPEHFYPNACHVCKKYGEEISLKICPGCHLIPYCDEQHLLDHWPEHQTFCEATQRVFMKNKIKDRYMNTEEINENYWSCIKLNYFQEISTELKRDLRMDEQQMIVLARACVVCYRQNNLIPCNNCPDVNFCMQHINEKYGAHAKHCKELKLHFDVEAVLDEMEPIDVHKIDIRQLFTDMLTFLCNCVPERRNLTHVKIYHSEYLTKPLTLFYAIDQMNLIVTGNLVVHVIAAHFSDDNIMHHWELLLHLLPPVISLTITSIGPDLKDTNYQTSVNLCGECIKMNKKITYEYFPKVYWDYVCTEDFKRPDVIVGFNVLLREFYNSPLKLSNVPRATVQALMARNCPYIMTLRMIPEYINESINFTNSYRYGLNPFRSIMPTKNVHMDTCHTNQYVITYKNIKDCQIVINESDFILT